MQSRQVAYYGLLACLVALLALGSLPLRIGRLTAEQRGPAERAPGEEPGDEERESEQASEQVVPLRRRVAAWHQAKGESRFAQAAASQNRSGVSHAALPRIFAEHAARNGVGGPLRL
ncbi:MAG: hypothetical protein ACR2FY_21730 [Pirellulaceae bacterium]